MENVTLVDEYQSIESAIAFGTQLYFVLQDLKELKDQQGQHGQEAYVQQCQTLVQMVDDLNLFEGPLSMLDSWKGEYDAIPAPGITDDSQQQPHTCILTKYDTSKHGPRYVLLTTADALPSCAATMLREVHQQVAGERVAMEAIVFLGRQRNRLSASELNKRSALANLPFEGTLPKRYLQTDDLLSRADMIAWTSSDGGRLRQEYRSLVEQRGRARSILFGNGINRINNDAHLSWGKVLELLKDDIDSTCSPRSIASNTVPSPIRFECLADHPGANPRIPIAGNIFDHLKGSLSLLMTGRYPDPSPGSAGMSIPLKYPPAALVTRLRQLSSSYILTTNYDQILEACLGSRDLRILDRKYLLHPTGRVVGASAAAGTKSRYTPLIFDAESELVEQSDPLACDGALLYHIHGIAADKHSDTICIGYEHYMGYVQHLRNRLIRNIAGRESACHIVHLMLGIVPSCETWDDLIFSTDMAIIGLGLNYEESDLWELLALRAAVLYTSKTLSSYLSGDTPPNRIVFYDIECVDDEMTNSVTIDNSYVNPSDFIDSKRQVLADLGVEVRVAHVSKNQSGVSPYALGFEAILDELANLGW